MIYDFSPVVERLQKMKQKVLVFDMDKYDDEAVLKSDFSVSMVKGFGIKKSSDILIVDDQPYKLIKAFEVSNDLFLLQFL